MKAKDLRICSECGEVYNLRKGMACQGCDSLKTVPAERVIENSELMEALRDI
ncbi:MAG: hypothetical protein V3T30_04870 [Thermodesulfobacteriota bacterium]